MKAENEDVFICCDAGESRSSAIAAALYEYEYGETADYIWNSQEYHPNMHIYRAMKEHIQVIRNKGDLHEKTLYEGTI